MRLLTPQKIVGKDKFSKGGIKGDLKTLKIEFVTLIVNHAQNSKLKSAIFAFYHPKDLRIEER